MKLLVAKRQVLIPLSICFFMITIIAATFMLNLGFAVWATAQTFPEFSQPFVVKAAYLTDFHFKEYPWFYAVAAVTGLLGIAYMIYKLRSNFHPIGTDEKGSQRFAMRKEIKQQYKAIPDRGQTYKGQGGPVLARKGNKAYIDPSPVNNLIIGTTRSGKGQTYVIPTIDAYSRAEKQASLIINDPKGELFASSRETLENRGYEVEVLNLMNPMQSMSFNLLELVKQSYLDGDYSTAQTLCETITHMLYHNPQAKEPMWDDSAKSLVNAMILAITEKSITEGTEEKITMYTVANMLSELGTKNEIDENGQEYNALDQYFQELPQAHVAKEQYATSNFSKGNTRSSIFTTAMNGLTKFTMSETAKMTAKNSLDLKKVGFGQFMKGRGTPFSKVYVTFPDGVTEVNQSGESGTWTVNFSSKLRPGDTLKIWQEQDPLSAKQKRKRTNGQGEEKERSKFTVQVKDMDGESGEVHFSFPSGSVHDLTVDQISYFTKPIALFMVTPDYDTSTHAIPSIFVSQLYYVLSKNAAVAKGQKCLREVVFVLDEFGNMPSIADMDNKITVCLGRNIRFHLVIQSYAQLKELYGEDGQATIRGNCGNEIYILSADYDSASYFSSKLGKQTLNTQTRSGSTFSLDKSKTESTEGRDLLTANELQELEEGDTVVRRVLKRRDKRGRKIRAFPIYNTGKHSMKYAHTYLSQDFDTSKAITEEEIDTPHRSVQPRDLVIDFSSIPIAEKEKANNRGMEISEENTDEYQSIDKKAWNQQKVGQFFDAVTLHMIQKHIAPLLNHGEEEMNEEPMEAFLYNLKMLGDGQEISRQVYGHIRKQIDKLSQEQETLDTEEREEAEL
ncbi:type IV secretory system conjugative DNA transfer family protein [Halobacillus shinanisalinarum]|uniref:Type IV secretory system conjugative DNA transfer family protein n=1 Tax=Halobacillus shinanisalinarum TaxID=2932258 RepID=A0ABY4H673_9BACI|nr:type IV secretory system conjugative DNA transfer family protein [Halobacillus shinanisalinarum]UOQ95087.1 type IV secretory system conjugative DNA transfer family protein [Halobacillus shinanisalinarum]